MHLGSAGASRWHNSQVGGRGGMHRLYGDVILLFLTAAHIRTGRRCLSANDVLQYQNKHLPCLQRR